MMSPMDLAPAMAIVKAATPSRSLGANARVRSVPSGAEFVSVVISPPFS